MPFTEMSIMDQRLEFVRLASVEGANRRELCRRYGISADTGYKWLGRYGEGQGDLSDRSRRPLSSPARSSVEIEQAVVAVRSEHPAWGARKIGALLRREGLQVPAPSTVHAILARQGCIEPPAGGARATGRFEREAPNSLWQMDFKGWIRTSDGRQLHPLTVVDDHSRFSVCLEACVDQTAQTVKSRLERVFARYGLPEAFFVDNGSPWGDSGGGNWTRFGVWLLKLGVDVLHSRPYHPQGRGKNERFHRTLDAEVLALRPLRDAAHAQNAFDAWRNVYNQKRPHEALAMEVPATRYAPSPRALPEKLAEPEYDSQDVVRRVGKTKDYVAFKGRLWKVPMAFRGETVAIRPLQDDGQFGVYFASHQIASIDLTQNQTVSHVSEQVSTMSPG